MTGSYINTTRVPRLAINDIDRTDRFISWSVTDQSAMKNGFIITTGQCVLGTTATSQFNYQKNRYKRGDIVTLDLLNPADGLTYQRHPRGLLYVIGESFDPSTRQVTLEIGCKLALAALSDNLDLVLPLSPLVLDESRKTFSNVRNAFAAAGQYLYQDNQGTLRSGSCFGTGSFGDPSSVESTWNSSTRTSIIRVNPITGAAPIPDEIKLSYSYAVTATSDDPPEIKTEENTSEYDIKYPGVIFTRVGSGKIPTDTTGDGGSGNSSSICGNSPQVPGQGPGSGNAGACSGIFRTVEEPTKKRGTRKEVTTTTYGGIGKQVSEVEKKIYGPAVEVNPQYFSDRLAYCRFNFATACNPNGSCLVEGMNEILQAHTIETYTYDAAGALIERNLEEYRPTLAAAQPFDWRAGVSGGVPTSFTDLSTQSTFRAKITNAKYSKVGDQNVEEITLSESSAVKSRAGVGTTRRENIVGGRLVFTTPSAYPTLTGSFSNLTVTNLGNLGNGAGMTVNVSYADASGKVKDVSVQSFDYSGGVYYPRKQLFAGGTGQGFRGTIQPIRAQLSVIEYKAYIDDPGQGYSIGDELTFTYSRFGVTTSAVIRIDAAEVAIPAIEVNTLGSGYEVGDQLQITRNTLSQAAGVNVDKGISFAISGAADSAVDEGKSIVTLNTYRRPQTIKRGHYTNVPVTVKSGTGSGASVNIEAINTGIVTKATPYQNPAAVASAGFYVQSIGRMFPTGGSGTGLEVELGIGDYIGVGSLEPSTIVVRRVNNAGTGYIRGDIVELAWQDIEEDCNVTLVKRFEAGIGQTTYDLKMRLEVENGTIYVFPSNPGTGFAAGDELEVPNSTLQGIGAVAAGQTNGINMRVVRVSADKSLGALRLDAAEGVKSVTKNTSSTKSTLPESPDTISTPKIDTETVETTIPVRTDQYNDDLDIAGPVVLQDSVPIPLLMDDKPEIQEALRVYGDYLKAFTMGEVLGMQIAEAMTPEVMTDWRPMIGFRYTDEMSGDVMALRADAASWAVSASESAVAFNGIWIGNEVPLSDTDNVGTTTVLDQGNYTEKINYHLRLSSRHIGIGGSGLITPFNTRPIIGQDITPVIAVTGLIVENGGTLSLDDGGGIPADYAGQILVDDVVIVDEDIFTD